MDMDMDASLVADLPLDDPQCRKALENCTAFAAAANASQEAIPFASQVAYGRWATYYYVCVLFLFIVVHGFNVWNHRSSASAASSSASRPKTTIAGKVIAAGRWFSYRRITIWPLNMLGLPSAGILTILMASIVLLTAMTFAARPYYREDFYFGSPPLAVRTGLMAYACVPILIALAGKANIITLLTGFSHEKLNILHQWVAWISLVLSWIHTIPFFVASLWEGWAKSESGYKYVKSEFYRDANPSELAGVPALGLLMGLCFLSLPYIRHRYYETFYWLHIPMAITYLGLLFWHAANVEDSWAYLWAALALWLASWIARLFWFTRPLNIRQSPWFVGSKAILTPLPGNMTKIEVEAPPEFAWRPSQHVFLRFPNVSMLDNHPFTIVSAPSVGSAKEPSALVFLARAHAGFTKRLAKYSETLGTKLENAWVDGPYGGISSQIERLYDTVTLVAGGTGVTPCLSWLAHIINQSRDSTGSCRARRVVFVWVFRDPSHFDWIAELLRDALALKPEGLEVTLKFYLTGDRRLADDAPEEDSKGKEKEIEAGEVQIVADKQEKMKIEEFGHLNHGRPDVTSVVKEVLGEGRNFVFGCGPESLRDSLATACAQSQQRVMKGEMQEIALHTEAFGW